ncbi:hypothetical protein Fmac_010280 [Flemingia macrophylla]|uniref:FAD-binding PCMH-type domain-containing protein n=1 Tax=Flemingia macrophylla TaxID=520843 RepID=A0ABD1MJ50_9FABA
MMLLSTSCADSTSVEKQFKKCLLTQLDENSESIEKIIFTSSSSLYPQVLDSLEQNPRWVNSSWKPLFILTPFHESEIQATIQCSKEHGLQLRVRSGGHDYEGLSYLSKVPFVMVDLINIRSIEINLDDETAWVQAGASLGELYYKISKDLFIRIVAQNSGDKSKTFQATFNSLFLGGIDKLIPLMNENFPELGLQAKDCSEMSWIRSVMSFAGYNKGDPLELLLNRTTMFKSSFKAKSDFVKDPIPKSGLEGAWKMILEEETLALMILEPYGGRMNEISESEIPFPHRKGNLYNIQYLVRWEENNIEESKRHLDWAKMIYRYMTPYVTKSPRAAYFNYKDLDLGKNKHENTSYSKASVWGVKYFKGNFRKLAQIKTKFDPQNFFNNEQSIPLQNSRHY